MNVIDYFCSDQQEYWLGRIMESDWSAGQYLYALLKNQTLKQLVGENTKVLMLVDGQDLISFCTYAEKDDIQPTDLTPWLGFVYTFPQYRGHRYWGEILRHAEALARADGIQSLYISTNHNGLYEKYGFAYWKTMKDIEGEDSKVYVKHL